MTGEILSQLKLLELRVRRVEIGDEYSSRALRYGRHLTDQSEHIQALTGILFTEEYFYDSVNVVDSQYILEEVLESLGFCDIFEKVAEGFVFKHCIQGYETSVFTLGLCQVFLLTDQDLSLATYRAGSYLVEVYKVCAIGVSRTELDAVNWDDCEAHWDQLEPEEEKVVGSALDLEQMLYDSILDEKSALALCLETFFPLPELSSEFECDDTIPNFEITPSLSDDNVILLDVNSFASTIPEGELAKEYSGAVRHYKRCFRELGYEVKITNRWEDFFAYPLTDTTFLSIYRFPGHGDASYLEPLLPLGASGKLSPEMFAQCLRSHNITRLSANAFASIWSGQDLYWSVSGFNPVDQRLMVLGLSFFDEGDEEGREQFKTWLRSFEGHYGKKLQINDSFEFEYPLEENPTDGRVPFLIPQAPESSSNDIGLACILFECEGLAGIVDPLNAPDISVLTNKHTNTPYLVTVPLLIPVDRRPQAFIQDALAKFGGLDLFDDQRVSHFRQWLIKYMMSGLEENQQSYLVAFILAPGHKPIQDLAAFGMPYPREGILFAELDEEQPNLEYSKSQLQKIQKEFQLRELRHLHFTHFVDFA